MARRNSATGTDTPDWENAAGFIKSLSHPMRLYLLHILATQGTANVNQICELSGEPQPTISQHLARLHRVGVIERKKKGTLVYYTLSNKKTLQDGLKYLTGLDLKEPWRTL